MGMPIDWGLVQPQPNFTNAFTGAFDAGRQIGLERQSDRALQQVQANPTDPSALTNLAVYNPNAANAFITMQNMQRAAQARDAAAGVFQASGAGGPTTAFAPQNAFAPPPAPAPPTGAPPAVAPGGSFAQTFAPYSAPGAPQGAPPQQGAPQGQPQSIQSIPPQSQPASALLQIGHPVTQAVGQAVANGMDLNSALAVYAHYANPDDLTAMISNVAKMDDVTRKRVADGNEALASAAFNLLQLPQDQRAAALDQIAPQLMQHGVSPEQIAQAKQEGLSDGLLHGAIGQAVGIDGLIKQANTVVDQQQKDRELATQQQTADQGRYESVDVQNNDGTTRRVTFDKQLGQYVDGPAGDGAAAGSTGSVARTHGYTPSTVNGGDNSSAAVQAKVAALSKAVGVEPDAPMTRAQLAGFVSSLPATEGGPGSLAARNNNPGNIQDGAFAKSQPGYKGANGGYAVFATRGAGMSALNNLIVNSYWNKGQRSVRDIIEGKPTGAPVAAQGGSYSVGGSGTPGGGLSGQGLDMAAAIYAKTGQMPQGLGRGGVAQRAVVNRAAQLTGGDVSGILTNWQDWKSGQQTVTAFDKGPQGNQVRALNVAIQHLDLYKQAARALQNGNVPMFNSVAQAIGRATGSAPPTNAQALHDLVMDEVTKGVLGTAGGVTDRGKAAAILGQAQSAAQLAGGFDQVMGLLNGQLNGLKQQYTSGTKRDDFEQKLSPTTRAAFAAYNASHGSRQAPAGASATATGPNGAKMALVGGKWVAY
jgi:hypothetical protein